MAAAINRAMPSLTCLDTGAQAILTIVDATRTHGDGARRVVALSHANLILRSGEFVAVMGPSGSGKSTLLNLAGGLDTPSSGKVLVEGRDLASLNVARRAAIRRRSIGYVFQDFNLLPSLNAIENVSFPLELDGWPIRKARKAALEALRETGVAELALRRPEDMSGGQAQRWPSPELWWADAACCWPTSRPAHWIPLPARRSWRCCAAVPTRAVPC